MHRDQPTTTLLGSVITQLDTRTDLTVCVEHHVPGQARDLALRAAFGKYTFQFVKVLEQE